MDEKYKVIYVSNEHSTYTFEELEYKINQAVKNGYRLKEHSIELFAEDRGNNQVTLYHVVATMIKKENTKKAKKKGAKKKTEENLP